MPFKVSAIIPVGTLALMAALLPAASADAARSDLAGFTAIEASAQGQAGTGYFFAVGEEENRLVGALSEINGPPAGSRNMAGFVQPGVAASYTYGTAGGGGPGQNGALPQPMPGLASAFFPADPPEATVQGPISTGAGKPVDGRYYAKATDEPSGLSEAAVTNYDAEAFAVQDASVVSRTLPEEGGVLAESTTVLRGLTIGPLRIEQMVSHARGLLPSTAGAEPTATANTLIYGATVNGIGVQITEEGVVVAGTAAPGAQKQVNDALSQGNMTITLARSTASTAEDKVTGSAGGLRVIYRDPALAQQNAQGFYGGGFSMGGADISVFGRRAL